MSIPRRTAPPFFSAPPRLGGLPSRLGGVCILILIFFLTGCQLPTEDLSQRQQIPGTTVRDSINAAVFADEVRLLDNRYLGYSSIEIAECLEAGIWIADQEYIPEFNDCDNYAIRTMGWVTGILPGIPFGLGLRETETCHAENLFVDEFLNVWIVDLRRRGSELIPASGAFYFLVMI